MELILDQATLCLVGIFLVVSFTLVVSFFLFCLFVSFFFVMYSHYLGYIC
jgi:hypothetical protein